MLTLYAQTSHEYFPYCFQIVLSLSIVSPAFLFFKVLLFSSNTLPKGPVGRADCVAKAAALALKTRDEQISGVIGQVLNIPVTCHPHFFPTEKYEYGSWQQNRDASIVNAPIMEWFWEQYMPEPKPEVYASPLLAKELTKLPPARKSCPAISTLSLLRQCSCSSCGP